jgi:hypothetical protein
MSETKQTDSKRMMVFQEDSINFIVAGDTAAVRSVIRLKTLQHPLRVDLLACDFKSERFGSVTNPAAVLDWPWEDIIRVKQYRELYNSHTYKIRIRDQFEYLAWSQSDSQRGIWNTLEDLQQKTTRAYLISRTVDTVLATAFATGSATIPAAEFADVVATAVETEQAAGSIMKPKTKHLAGYNPTEHLRQNVKQNENKNT